MLPSWNSLHTLLVARAVLLWHGGSYPMLRCSSLARHRILYGRTLPCAPYRTMPLILVVGLKLKEGQSSVVKDLDTG